MGYILNGVVRTDDKNQKVIYYLGKNYIIDNPNDFELIDNMDVRFILEKKIFSDTIDIIAKVFNPINNTWDEIYNDFIKKSSNFTLSDFQNYLKSNYKVPELINQ